MKSRALIKEDVFPYIRLTVPVDNESLFDGSPEHHLAKVTTCIELVRNVDLGSPSSITTTRDAVWDHMTVGFQADVLFDETSLHGIRPIVEHKRTLRKSTGSGLHSS